MEQNKEQRGALLFGVLCALRGEISALDKHETGAIIE
jgi:hypothetical protein